MPGSEGLPCWFAHRRHASIEYGIRQIFDRRNLMPHPAMSPGNVAVITGGASGIGLAAAMRYAGLGMKICIADIGADRLAEAAAKLAAVAKGGAADDMSASVDVSRFDDVAGL